MLYISLAIKKIYPYLIILGRVYIYYIPSEYVSFNAKNFYSLFLLYNFWVKNLAIELFFEKIIQTRTPHFTPKEMKIYPTPHDRQV